MPQNATISLPAGQWTQITNADVSAIRVQSLAPLTSQPVWIKATAGAVAPTSRDGAIRLLPNQAIGADMLIGSLFPGVSGANRVYAIADDQIDVSVSHA